MASVQRTDRTPQPRLQGRRLAIHGRSVTSAFEHRLLRPCPDRTTDKARHHRRSSWRDRRCVYSGADRRSSSWPWHRRPHRPSQCSGEVRQRPASTARAQLIQQRKASEPQGHWRSSRKTSGRHKSKADREAGNLDLTWRWKTQGAAATIRDHRQDTIEQARLASTRTRRSRHPQHHRTHSRKPSDTASGR